MTAPDDSSLVLVWTPRGRDGKLATELLARTGLHAVECATVEDVVAGIASAGCAVIAAEALTEAARAALVTALAAQPPWSDFPIVLFAPRGTDRTDDVLAAMKILGNVTILERPVHSGTLVSAVVSALRGRARQYEAREAIRRRDQFLAMLGHELRNPLGSIVLALETMPLPDDHPAARQRAIIDRQAHHLARLVDDLLDVARVTSGKVNLQRAPLDLREVVQRCVAAAELVARGRALEVTLEAPSRPLVIDGDLVRLEEVFNNLLGNAIKYSPDGTRIHVRLASEGRWHTVEIHDGGIGIAPAMLPRVFELFEQATPTLDRRQGGLGVGLTLVRALVELHGGTVEAQSDGLGHGSRFTVRLPPSQAEAPLTASRLPPVREAPVTIVVVEDNADLLAMTKELLEATGAVVHTASDGPTGLATIIDVGPDLAIIDIGLPGLDGYQIAQRLRGLDAAACLVAMTGYGQPEDRQRAHAAGFDLHLTKPVTSTALQQAIATCHRRRAERERRTR